MSDARQVAGMAALVGVCAGGVAGAAAALIVRPTPSAPAAPIGPPQVSVDKLVAADRLKVVENAGQTQVIAEGREAAASFIHPKDGGGVLNLYGPDGGLRVQAGSYDRGAERGLPLLGLSDNHARLRLLLRLAGKNESPVLIFKDTRGHDRLVLGLALNDPKQAPFIAAIDESGKKTLLTGSF